MGDGDALLERERLIDAQRRAVARLAHPLAQTIEVNLLIAGTTAGTAHYNELREREQTLIDDLRQALHDLDAMQRGEFDASTE